MWGQPRVAVILPGSIMKHQFECQNVSLEEPAVPFRLAVGRTALYPGHDPIHRNGSQEPRPEKNKAYIPAALN